LPNLDDLTWEDLTTEAHSLIPAKSPEWTNFNPSDPGITLIELFAYFSESLMYELNRVSANNMMAFLRLIHGPGWEPGQSLGEEKRNSVLEMRKPHRAITTEDFEALTLAVNEEARRKGLEGIARAKCIFRRNLESEVAAAQVSEAPGHVSVVVVPAWRHPASAALLHTIKQALEPARLITTRIHVVRPRLVPFGVRADVTPSQGVDPDRLRDEIIRRLQSFFDPLDGGSDGRGWPFGKSVYLSEVYEVLAKVPGVDYVSRNRNPITGEEMDELVVSTSERSRILRNAQLELEAIQLSPDELVSLQLDKSEIRMVGA
jgi:hypothetical protein